jgi:hypothetical protein
MKPEKELLIKRVFETAGYVGVFDSVSEKKLLPLIDELVIEKHLIKVKSSEYGNSTCYSLTEKGANFALGGFTEGEEMRKATAEKKERLKEKRDFIIKLVGVIGGSIGVIIAILKYLFNRS